VPPLTCHLGLAVKPNSSPPGPNDHSVDHPRGGQRAASRITLDQVPGHWHIVCLGMAMDPPCPWWLIIWIVILAVAGILDWVGVL